MCTYERSKIIKKNSVVVMCDLTNFKDCNLSLEIVVFFLYIFNKSARNNEKTFIFLNCNTLLISYYTKVNSKFLSQPFLFVSKDCITKITTTNLANTLKVVILKT